MADQLNSEPMSSVDRAWLGMDSETNLMIINGVMIFDEMIEYGHGFATPLTPVLPKRFPASGSA